MTYGPAAGHPASARGIPWRRSGSADVSRDNPAPLRFTPPGFAEAPYRVLVAHDLTARSEIAMVRAIRLARERNGNVTVLHVVDGSAPGPDIAARRVRARKHLESELRRWVGRGTMPCRVDIGIGDPASAIAARARAHDVDLVVTGQHASADRRAVTVGRLLRQVHQPVLIVRRWDQSPYRRVLIPFDLTIASAVRVRHTAALLPEAHVHLLHACKRGVRDAFSDLTATFASDDATATLSRSTGRPSEEALSRFVATLGLDERRPLVTIETGDPATVVRQELARQKTDLLVCGARVGLGRALVDGHVRGVLESRLSDVLILPQS